MPKKRTKGKVFVALSGGVDSSVSAALLKNEGYDLTGVFIKVWQPDFLPCTWREERRDAMRAAAKLNIPFLTFDFEKEYKRDVIDYMLLEYESGRTPNPDVFCNKYIKFGAFYDKARKLGADFIATGHYARVEYDSDKIRYRLLVGIDGNKDQTYFLWNLTQEILSHILLPIGDYKKDEVRRLAKKFGLFTAEKKDSQGLCFIGEWNLKDFLSHYISLKQGVVLNTDGQIIGEHSGAWLFTPGERHGFSVQRKSSHDEPLFVLNKDLKANTIIVGTKYDIDTANKSEITLKNVNIISELAQKCSGRPRYRAPLTPCIVKKENSGLKVSFIKKPPILAPGQSFVFYGGEECLGGGIIT